MRRATVGLAAALAAAVALDVALRRPAPVTDVGRLPAFDAADVAVVRIHEGDDEFALVRAGAGWTIPGPPDRAADPARVDELLAGLSRGVPLDAQVDRGSYEDYGLAGADPVRVDVLGPGEAAIASVVLGFDAGGGATWVRLPGDDAVYRARVGGRARYDRPRAAWRDRRVLALPELQRIAVTRPHDAYALAGGDAWTIHGSGAPVDPVLIREVARVLSDLRALDVVAEPPAGEPAARVTLGDAARDVELALWPPFAQIEGEDVAFRLAPALAGLLAGPVTGWADLTLWFTDPARVSELRLDETERVILARGPSGWAVVEPTGVAIDPARVAGLAASLAAPRVEGWLDVSASEAGFIGGPRVVVAWGDERRTLEIGGPVPGRPAGREAVYVRDPRRPERIGAWSAGSWAAVRAGFGR